MSNVNFFNEISGNKLNIRTYPDPVLTKIAAPISEFNQVYLKKVIIDMLHTMYLAPGIGLAAPQVGLSERLFVLDINYEKITNDDGTNYVENALPFYFINPEIISYEERVCYQEGCLSVPEIYEEVERHKKITLKYQDIYGKFHTIEANNLMSICIQHEMDHLDGIVFIERLGNVKKNLIKSKITKKKRSRKL